MDKNDKKSNDEAIGVLEKERDDLRHQVEALQAEKEELFAKLQRVSADYVNFEKRMSRQASETVAYEKEKIINSLLPVLDNFEHTLAQAPVSEATSAILQGVQIIHDQMLDVLKSHGVEPIEAVDEPFDPTHHEAMMHRMESDKDNHVVLEEFRKGYKLNDRVIRPSRVVINKIPSEEISEGEIPEPDDFESTDTE